MQYKRQVVERLAGGLTMAQIIKASDNALNEAKLLAILNRASVPEATYRVLDSALSNFE